MNKVAFIARADNSGLGTLSWEFVRHLKPDRTLIIDNGVYRSFPRRIDGEILVRPRNFSLEDMEWLVRGMKVLVMAETPYNSQVVSLTKNYGVKTVMIPMFESLPIRPERYDLYLCPSKLDYDEAPEPKRLLPWPVDRDRVPFRLRKKANVFVHNAGHGGIVSRNGTDEFIKAIPLVKSDVQFIIHSQVEVSCDDPRVEVRVGNLENYWDLYEEGDVLVLPQKFAGLSLPVNEALSSGMAVMHSDIYPFNEYLPKEMLIPIKEKIRVAIYRRFIDYAVMSPNDIAQKIDEWANKDITEISKKSDRLAEEISWEKLKPEYIKTLENV